MASAISAVGDAVAVVMVDAQAAVKLGIYATVDIAKTVVGDVKNAGLIDVLNLNFSCQELYYTTQVSPMFCFS